jgi:DNA topoisomerase-1
MKLVIVESPAKCKKIESYLGIGYKCIASYGHIREFLNGLKSIDIAGSTFKPSYKLMISKKKYINQLRTNIKKASEVILATDDDREGEAIAWHICMSFQLPIQHTKRIIFHEITKPAIKKALANPTTLNLNKIYSQQSRQILDLLVGYKISPILWSNISRRGKLSAGRCQSTALRLVYDNYKTTENQTGKKVYSTSGLFNTNAKSDDIFFELTTKIKDVSKIEEFLEESVFFDHNITNKEIKKVMKKPPTPLTTSKLQQKASNDIGFSPKQTMMCAQRLYENGYITYMRTDSTKYSAEFVKKAKNFIIDNYGENYGSKNLGLITISKNNKSENEKSKKKKNLAQEAHEAIRPTDIKRTSLQINSKITTKELKLYLLIYKNALASCMANSIYDKLTLTLSAPLSMEYKSCIEKNDFPGWKIVYGIEDNLDLFNRFNDVNKQDMLNYSKVNCNMSIIDLKQHYTESKLIQLLEKKGIGRPSTFSSIISKIQDKGYVHKENVPGIKIKCDNYELVGDEIETTTEVKEFGAEKNKLVLQPTGILVIEFLIKHFDQLFEYDYTRNMESMLDEIANGEKKWTDLCDDCNKSIDQCIKKIKKVDKPVIKIDEHHTYIIGKYGPVIKCEDENGISFKQINKSIKLDLEKLKSGKYTLKELMSSGNNQYSQYNRNLGNHNGEEVILKKGKFGMYVNIGGKNKSVKNIKKEFDDVELSDVVEYLNKKPSSSTNIIKHINDDISIRKGIYGPYVYYKTSTMRVPKFISMKGTTQEEITVSWVQSKIDNK